jgi:hypothetical protein
MEIKIGGISFGEGDGEVRLDGIGIDKPKDDEEKGGEDAVTLGGIRFVRSKDGVKRTSMGPAGITIELGHEEFDRMLHREKTEVSLDGISIEGQPGSVGNIQAIKSININMKSWEKDE